jgi:pantothenate kinase-related protein Tda10
VDPPPPALSTREAEIWARLCDFLRARLASLAGRTAVVGIVGLPGCGKSTLAARLLASLALPRSLSVSLDDFYLDGDERRARGLPLRGPPGTHDLPLLAQFLAALAAGASPLAVPVYDREHEQRRPPREVAGPLTLCLIEGWFVGARCPGYEGLADALDLLLYLDMDSAAARAARLQREASLRERGRGGMDEAAVRRFWDQALAPHFSTLVLPLRRRADACLTLGPTHELVALSLRRPD